MDLRWTLQAIMDSGFCFVLFIWVHLISTKAQNSTQWAVNLFCWTITVMVWLHKPASSLNKKCNKYCRHSLIRFSFSKQWFYISHRSAVYCQMKACLTVLRLTPSILSHTNAVFLHFHSKKQPEGFTSQVKMFIMLFFYPLPGFYH